MSNTGTDFETGKCMNCGERKDQHTSNGLCQNVYESLDPPMRCSYLDTGIARICREDNAVRVLKAAIKIVNTKEWEGNSREETYAELKSACEASTKRD